MCVFFISVFKSFYQFPLLKMVIIINDDGVLVCFHAATEKRKKNEIELCMQAYFPLKWTIFASLGRRGGSTG